MIGLPETTWGQSLGGSLVQRQERPGRGEGQKGHLAGTTSWHHQPAPSPAKGPGRWTPGTALGLLPAPTRPARKSRPPSPALPPPT